MITKDQAAYAERRYGVTLPTWLDANDLAPGIATLARAVAAGLRKGMEMRAGLYALIGETRRDMDAALGQLNTRGGIEEDLPARSSVPERLKHLADHEDALGALVLALHEATDEPHP